MTTFQGGFSTAVATGGRVRKRLLLCIAFMPLIAAVAVFIVLWPWGTSGFQIEKTQHCFMVPRTADDLNPVQADDCITHIGGIAYPNVLGHLLIRSVPEMPLNRITLLRDGKTQVVDVRYTPLKPFGLFTAIGPYILFVLLSVVLCVSVLRWTPSGQPAGLFILIMSSFAVLFVSQFPLQLGILDPARISAAFLTTTAANWIGFSAWLHFAFRFPVTHQVWPHRPWTVIGIVYLAPPAVAIGLCLWLGGVGPDFFGWLQRLRRWAVPFIMLTIGLKLLTDYRAADDVATKNQIRLIVAGIGIGIGVYLLLYLIPNIILNRPLVPFYVVALSSALIPLALFLAMVRYRLLDVDQMISWTLSHLVLLGALTAVYAVVLLFLRHALGEDAGEVWSEGFFITAILIIAVFFAPARNRLEHAIDVLFFRQKIDYRKVLHAFSGKIVAAIRMADLTRMIVSRLPAEFNLEKAGLCIIADGRQRIYPDTDSVLKYLARLESIPRRLRADAPFLLCAKGYADPDLAREAEDLVRHGYRLVLRLQSRTAFIGMLMLGKKRNHTFYSGRDIQALATLANQVATAVENALNFESLERSQEALKRMFAKVLQAEKLATIGEIAAVMAHEIKNPLGVIRSSAQFLAESTGRDTCREELLGFIMAEVDRLTTVVNHMLDMARHAPPTFSMVDPARLLEHIARQWGRSADHNPAVEIQCRCDPVKAIHADPQQLTQVALNLIRNSEEAMPEGGRLDIHLGPDGNDDGVVIRFMDTGHGVAPEEVPNLWQKFYTTRKDGIGLGLSVCKQIVESHGGGIDIQSRAQGGVTVTIRLPGTPDSALHPVVRETMPSGEPAQVIPTRNPIRKRQPAPLTTRENRYEIENPDH